MLVALLATDPSRGVSTGLLLMSLASGIVAVLFAHLARKALHDYIAADMEQLFKRAGEHPIGAGLALIALALVSSALLGLFGRAAHASEIPPARPSRTGARQALPAIGCAPGAPPGCGPRPRGWSPRRERPAPGSKPQGRHRVSSMAVACWP